MDHFAICISNKGIQMYGSSHCGACTYQKNLFGESFRFIDETECAQDIPGNNYSLCTQKNITHYPTWIFAEKRISGAKTLQELATFSGCTYTTI